MNLQYKKWILKTLSYTGTVELELVEIKVKSPCGAIKLIKCLTMLSLICINYLCTYDLYRPVCNVFYAGENITRGGPGNQDFFGP